MLWWFQEQIVFQPPTRHCAHTRRRPSGAAIAPPTAWNCSHTSWAIVHPMARSLLAFHGNADIARWFVPWATNVVRHTGACVMLPEYRGYDGIPGKPTYAASSHDAKAALAFAHDYLHVSPDRIVYFGHSLGSAIAAELAAASPPRALVLQARSRPRARIATRMFTIGVSALWTLISRVQFDTLARVHCASEPGVGRARRRGPRHSGPHGARGVRRRGAAGGVADRPRRRPQRRSRRRRRDYWAWLARAVRSRAAPPVNPVARAETKPAP